MVKVYQFLSFTLSKKFAIGSHSLNLFLNFFKCPFFSNFFIFVVIILIGNINFQRFVTGRGKIVNSWTKFRKRKKKYGEKKIRKSSSEL